MVSHKPQSRVIGQVDQCDQLDHVPPVGQLLWVVKVDRMAGIVDEDITVAAIVVVGELAAFVIGVSVVVTSLVSVTVDVEVVDIVEEGVVVVIVEVVVVEVVVEVVVVVVIVDVVEAQGSIVVVGVPVAALLQTGQRVVEQLSNCIFPVVVSYSAHRLVPN